VPVSVRIEGDTRANSLDRATIRIEPTGVVDDLTGLREATKAALVAVAEQSYDLAAALPLTPLMPAAAVRRAEPLAMGASALPVGCSNYGDLPAAVVRLDGRDSNDFWVRLIEPGQGPADLDRIGGQLYVLSGRALGNVFLSIVARPVGGGLGRDELLCHIEATLAEFGLSPTLVTR
jgi:diacylglycerol O-acyltransferase